jgi:hypothetical protein
MKIILQLAWVVLTLVAAHWLGKWEFDVVIGYWVGDTVGETFATFRERLRARRIVRVYDHEIAHAASALLGMADQLREIVRYIDAEPSQTLVPDGRVKDARELTAKVAEWESKLAV